MTYIFTAVFMINAFHKQHLSHHDKPVFENVLFYVSQKENRPKDTTKTCHWQSFVICRMNHFLLSISYSSPTLTAWDPCTCSVIWTSAFFIHSKIDLLPLSSVGNCWNQAFCMCVHTPLFILHILHEDLSWGLWSLVLLPLLSELKAEGLTHISGPGPCFLHYTLI